MKKFFYLNMGAWVLVVIGSLFWNIRNIQQQRIDIAFQSARNFFDQIIITREWNAGHQSIYVPVTATNKPNTYLKDADRDLQVNRDLTLTKINPAYMTREISEISARYKGVQFHITSLKPLNPGNAATEREKEALKSFQGGNRETGYFIKDRRDVSFFYMAPLVTTESCLPCHVQQGYKVGDIRGGISVTFPSLIELSIVPVSIAHFLIGTLGMAGIFFFGKKLDEAYVIVKQHAAIDALTGIPNRRTFIEKILEEFKRSKRKNEPLSVLFCDIDDFKKYNDTYGHAAGDDCLNRIAQIIKTSLERPGDFCARYGGEEFVVILPDTHSAGALSIAERILQNARNLQIRHRHSSSSPFVTLSIGAATLDSLCPSDAELIKQADAALYEAKRTGKNCVVQHSTDLTL
jgi:diguanylate cyclase (GGDEF)-like protein